jgi:hypothetical protein
MNIPRDTTLRNALVKEIRNRKYHITVTFVILLLFIVPGGYSYIIGRIF